MQIRKIVLFFILVDLIATLAVVSGVTFSFLESSVSSFSFIRIASDNRARDTVVSLAKAAEGRMNPKGYLELSQAFARLKEVTSSDSDGFRAMEIVLVDPNGNILASSEEKPDPSRYRSEVFSRGLRMRKWEYPDPVVLDLEGFQKEAYLPNFTSLYQFLKPLVDSYFPEVKEATALVSSAVYHRTKLDVLGALHLIYVRGNFALYLEKQRELYFWFLYTYLLVATGAAILITILYYIFFVFDRKNLKTRTKIPGEPAPPVIEKVVETQKERSQSVQNLPNGTHFISGKPKNKDLVVDAIYLGDYGN